ncbi:MAG: hypothetical protein M1838_003986 [Thelocarpon superellum]|nr:MAG: hypothetical protein M1838_003986 [Thelocarpon superellum]
MSDIMSSVVELGMELRRGPDGQRAQRSPEQVNVATLGVHQSLRWTLDQIRSDLELLRMSPVAPSSYLKNDISELSTGYGAESQSTHGKGGRRSIVDQSPPSVLASSIRTSSTGSIFLPSAMQASGPPSRLLPSPPAATFPSPPVADTSLPASSMQPSQALLQDLQHQVSTKTLALQTLQQEHDRVLAALSRVQNRCGILEKKVQSSEVEIRDLGDERVALQSQVESSESQLEDLVKSRDEARRHSVANGGQYMKIMSLASRLEAQSVADNKQWKSEKEEWERERQMLAHRIRAFEEREGTGGRSSALVPSASRVIDDILESTSTDELRAEIIRLRDICQVLDRALQRLRHEGEQIMQRFGGIFTDVGSIGLQSSASHRLSSEREFVAERSEIAGLLASTSISRPGDNVEGPETRPEDIETTTTATTSTTSTTNTTSIGETAADLATIVTSAA